MNKSAIRLITILLVSLAFLHLNSFSQNKLPENVMAIFTNSCLDCHADDANKIAAVHVNFSRWDQYSRSKQVKKSTEIVKVMAKGKMPPKGYISSRPDAAPTAAQLDIIKKWGESQLLLNKKQ
jgi:hypothetical protein